MEAVPKLPMIQFELKAISSEGSEPTEFGPALKKYITHYYHEDGESYSKEVKELEILRNAVSRTPRDFTGCSLLKKYFSQLLLLENRFPMTNNGSASVPFSWSDAYTGIVCTVNDIKYEECCVLYNIGALHSELGAVDKRSDSDSMKISCTHFQCAAWAFQQVRDNYVHLRMSDTSSDMLTFCINVMLAQAQECILEKSMLDNRKCAIVAKVAAQIIEYYRLSLKALDPNTANKSANADRELVIETVGSKQYKAWKRFIEFKVSYLTSVSLLYQGMQVEEQQKMGERVAYYQAAVEQLNQAHKLAKNLDYPEVVEALTFTKDVIGGKYSIAQRENDFIYHERVPDIASLPEVKGASLVKGIAFNPSDPEILGSDIFARLVPMQAHEGSSVYSEEKAKLLRKVTTDVDAKNEELGLFMASMQLDQLQLDSTQQDTGLPQELIECCAQLSTNPDAIKDLVSAMQKLSNTYHDVESNIEEIKSLLEEDNAKEKHFNDVMGKRAPSMVIIEIAKELKFMSEAHLKAADSNAQLHKLMNANIQNIKLMTGTLEQLEACLPSVKKQNDGTPDPTEEGLRRLVLKVDEMKKQRCMLENQLRDQIRDDDITQALIANKDKNNDVIRDMFETELRKHDHLIKLIEQNLFAQDNILRALTDANAQYAPTRRERFEIGEQRRKMVAALIASFNSYEDLLSKCERGIEFYTKLEGQVKKLMQRTKSICNVQEEERNSLLVNQVKKGEELARVPTSSTGGPKLKDYLQYMGGRGAASEGLARLPIIQSAVAGNMTHGQLPPSSVSSSPNMMQMNKGAFPQNMAGQLGYPTAPSSSTPSSINQRTNQNIPPVPFSQTPTAHYSQSQTPAAQYSQAQPVTVPYSQSQAPYGHSQPPPPSYSQSYSPRAENFQQIRQPAPVQHQFPGPSLQNLVTNQQVVAVPQFPQQFPIINQGYAPPQGSVLQHMASHSYQQSYPATNQNQAYPIVSQASYNQPQFQQYSGPHSSIHIQLPGPPTPVNQSTVPHQHFHQAQRGLNYGPLPNQHSASSQGAVNGYQQVNQFPVSSQNVAVSGYLQSQPPVNAGQGVIPYSNQNVQPGMQTNFGQNVPTYPAMSTQGNNFNSQQLMQQYPNSNVHPQYPGSSINNQHIMPRQQCPQGQNQKVYSPGVSGTPPHNFYVGYAQVNQQPNLNVVPQVVAPSQPSYYSATPLVPSKAVAGEKAVGKEQTTKDEKSNLSLLEDLKIGELASGDGLPDKVLKAAVDEPQVKTVDESSVDLSDDPTIPKKQVKVINTDPYSDPEVLNRLVADVDKFEKTLEGLSKHSLNGPTPLEQKWKELQDSQDADSRKLTISVGRCYATKNRHPDIMPYDFNRVEIKEGRDDYINASHLKDLSPISPQFITTQCPLSTTSADFWTAIFEQQVELICCLVSDSELKTNYQYWPSERSHPVEAGPFLVTLQSQKAKPWGVERLLAITHGNNKSTRVVVHLQFGFWPPSDNPESPALLLQFISELKAYHKQQRILSRPIVIHCSTGVGRTGILCLVWTLINEIDCGNGLTSDAIWSLALRLQKQRKYIFQDKGQLRFCFLALLYHAQDILMKRGILSSRQSFDERRLSTSSASSSKSHRRHPSEDFVMGPSDFGTLQSRVTSMGSTSAASLIGQEIRPPSAVGSVNSSPAHKSPLTNATDAEKISRSGSSVSIISIGSTANVTLIAETSEATLDVTSSKSSDTLSVQPSEGGSGVIDSTPSESNSITRILDPNNFKMDADTSSNKKSKITKENFTNPQRAIGAQVDASDPLSLIDPLWTLQKK